MHVVRFIPNSEDGRHCTQAAFRMVHETMLGVDPGFDEAERMTGYVAGRGTWQFRLMLSLADAGLNVVDCELFDTGEFLRDPILSITKQVGDPVVAAKNVADTDLESEVEALGACLNHPRVRFEERIPTVADLDEELARGRLLLCIVNANILLGTPGHVGHMVVVDQVSDEHVRLQNPGPPPEPDQVVSVELFERAWCDPSPALANYISVGT